MMWKRLKLLLKWFARGLGLLLAVLVLFIVEENIRGKLALRSYVRQLHRQGEKLTLAELGLSKTSPPSDAVTELIAGGKELETLKRDSSFNMEWQFGFKGVHTTDESGRRWMAFGEAMVRHQRANLGIPLIRRSNNRMDTNWDDLAGEVSRTSNALAKVKAALAKPGLVAHLDWLSRETADWSHLSATRAAAEWLAVEAMGDLHRGEIDAAIRNIATLETLAHFLEDEPLVNSQFVRQFVARAGMYLTWETLQAPGVTEEQLAVLQSVWESGNFTDGLFAHLQGERAWRLGLLERIRRSPHAFWEVCKGEMSCCHACGNGACDLGDFLFDARQMPRVFLWRLAWFDWDELECLKQWQDCLDQARVAVAQGDRARYRFNDDFFSRPRRSLYDSWRFLQTRQLEPQPEMMVLTPMRVETERRMTLVAIALKRYQLAHGVLPDSLAGLTPVFLADVPRDMMDGQPLRYRWNDDGTSLLYSAGQNSEDDGGSLERDREHLPNGWLWMTCDAVWPSPTSREPPPRPVAEDYSGGGRGRARRSGI